MINPDVLKAYINGNQIELNPDTKTFQISQNQSIQGIALRILKSDSHQFEKPEIRDRFYWALDETFKHGCSEEIFTLSRKILEQEKTSNSPLVNESLICLKNSQKQ